MGVLKLNDISYSGGQGAIALNDVNYPSGSGGATLITKTITENGVYDATDDNADGYSEVTVTVDTKEYVDISSFAYYFKRNTSTPTVSLISNYEASLSFTDQNASGYELASFSVTLEAGIYIAEIKATVNKNTGLNTAYMWGIYASDTTSGAQLNDNGPMSNANYGSYVAFDRTDTNEHFYEVPMKIRSDGAGYICFGTAADNGQNATITVSSLKIWKVL